jgi:Ser/Thr protein kinase RdoA (MazF antagonist)
MPKMPVVVQHAPRFTAAQAEALAVERYGVRGRAAALPSERDQNFRIDAAGSTSFVLKIANTTEREEVLDFQNAALQHLARHGSGAGPPPPYSGRTAPAARKLFQCSGRSYRGQ